MLISEKYRKMQAVLHDNKGYGMSAGRFADEVKNSGYTDILDYGCGKRLLEKYLGFEIHNYDPAIKGLENNNRPHEFVYCGDVLEHIEPDYLDDVMKDIKRCTLKKCILVIATRPAKRILPDGRNAHLIVNNADWWRGKISEHFIIEKEVINEGEYIAWA